MLKYKFYWDKQIQQIRYSTARTPHAEFTKEILRTISVILGSHRIFYFILFYFIFGDYFAKESSYFCLWGQET